MKLGNCAKIGIGWTVCIVASVYAFYLSKESVDRKRYQHMKLREQIRLKALQSGE